MDFSPEPVLIEVVAPDASAASQILRSYIDDVASRYYGRQTTDKEIHAALREDPSIDLQPPSGVFLVARQRDAVLGCAGLRLLPKVVLTHRGLPSTHLGNHRAGWEHQLGRLLVAAG